ncbi:uncharacterized protein LOC127857266 [Dreissena polymorpha]|uniref:Protein sleepless n=1 Tax=Dreissena polymorpha TaxID=45954 RepID=A0A9D3YZI4_DREPO|nr:uncharacterized protein LOC127857266 [Dreissena polymorpha]KAH3709162.1 hypothetical protein DPMN_068623 [Dreissena polymorpha]
MRLSGPMLCVFQARCNTCLCQLLGYYQNRKLVGTNILVLTSVLTVLLFASNVDAAFRCYTCYGTAKCADEFSKSSDLESGATCRACTKVKKDGVVIRECSSFSYDEYKCEKKDGAEGCVCDTELCNSSNNLAVSMATILGATLAVLFAKFTQLLMIV